MLPDLLATCCLALLYVSQGAYGLSLKKSNRPNEGDVRLSGSDSASEGRVEVYHNGVWGTVCDDNWDLADAQVVCRQLNFQEALSAVPGGRYREGSGQIWLDEVQCKGTEQQLVSCTSNGWGKHDCRHAEDAGVICDKARNDMTQNDNMTHDNMIRNKCTDSLDHSTFLSDDLGKVFDSGTACDYLITFQTPTGNKQENGTTEKTTICVHKAILMLYPHFNVSVGENNMTVTVKTTCRSYFTSFIRYLYTRQINVTLSSVMCLHQFASDFEVRPLMEDLGQVISTILPDDASFYSPVSLYKYAVQSKDLVLKNSCVQYLAWNFQSLTSSPVWANISVELLHALLTRSDLVVPDEYFVLHILENWITNNGTSLSSESQADLLRLVRFPMISAQKLYELQSNSLLFNAHRDLYRDCVFKAYQFNVLLYSSLIKSELSRENDDYKPRIYTGETWSTTIDTTVLGERFNRYRRYIRNGLRYNPYRYDYPRYSQYNYPTTPPPTPPPLKSVLEIPLHNSPLFEKDMISWEANVFKTMSECSKKGEHCQSVPAARLVQKNNPNLRRTIRFNNRVLLTCQNRYICQIQAFHNNKAYINTDDQPLTYPCPDDNYIYTFVVRPEFV